MKVCWGGFTQLRHLLYELLMIFRNKRGELAKDDLLGWQCIVFLLYVYVYVSYILYICLHICMYVYQKVYTVGSGITRMIKSI